MKPISVTLETIDNNWLTMDQCCKDTTNIECWASLISLSLFLCMSQLKRRYTERPSTPESISHKYIQQSEMMSVDVAPVVPRTANSLYSIVFVLCIVSCLCSGILLVRVTSLVNSRSAKFPSRRSFVPFITALLYGFLCYLKPPKLRNCFAAALCSSPLFIRVVSYEDLEKATIIRGLLSSMGIAVSNH